MARPMKRGLEYFSLDVDIFEDDKIFDLQNEYGPLGEVIYMRLLCLVYRNGYYYHFESLDKLAGLLIKSIGNRWARDRKAVKDVILYCAKCNLFSSELMQNNVITSRSIQSRYLKAKERNLPKIEEYNLLEKNPREGLITAPENQVNVAETAVNVAETQVNVCNNPTKESKEKEIKEKESSAAPPPAPPTPKSPRELLAEKYGSAAVADYEQRYRNWQAKSGRTGGDMYAAIAKWMAQDGVTKPAGVESSFDVDEVMRREIEKYGKRKAES